MAVLGSACLHTGMCYRGSSEGAHAHVRPLISLTIRTPRDSLAPSNVCIPTTSIRQDKKAAPKAADPAAAALALAAKISEQIKARSGGGGEEGGAGGETGGIIAQAKQELQRKMQEVRGWYVRVCPCVCPGGDEGPRTHEDGLLLPCISGCGSCLVSSTSRLCVLAAGCLTALCVWLVGREGRGSRSSRMRLWGWAPRRSIWI
jgi:hypothetical protein